MIEKACAIHGLRFATAVRQTSVRCRLLLEWNEVNTESLTNSPFINNSAAFLCKASNWGVADANWFLTLSNKIAWLAIDAGSIPASGREVSSTRRDLNRLWVSALDVQKRSANERVVLIWRSRAS